MANSQIQQYLRFANLQMAAEAFIVEQGSGGNAVVPSDAEVRDRLVRGNFHASRFSLETAQDFIDTYEVIAQYRNDPREPTGTGFSGTLFRDRMTGELTLSFRSTEFIDDAVRDGKATNELEIKELGWAFGQIAEMEKWYAELHAPGGFLEGKSFNVTGYSLGAHLATAFNILRREEAIANDGIGNPILATYTFNGAGTGGIKGADVILTQLVADFNRIKADYATAQEWTSLSVDEQTAISIEANSRVNKITGEETRVAGLVGVTRAFADTGATAPAGDQTSLSYQIAAVLVGKKTTPSFDFPFAGTNDLPTTPNFVAGHLKFSTMTEVVGLETDGLATSFVSNSGLHYGTRESIFIEGQPRFRGFFNPVDLAQRNFLVDNPGQNDLGDTHSLVLLVDSLSVLALFEALDPAFTLEKGKKLFQAASSAAASTLILTQGTAEGDVLERVVDALYKLLVPAGSLSNFDYQTLLNSNTWHLNGLREPFHLKVTELQDVIREIHGDDSSPTFQVRLVADFTSTQINEMHNGTDATALAYRYALKELNPFVVLGSSELYSVHNVNGELNLYDPATGIGTTGVYWSSREQMLNWKNKYFEADGNIALRGKDTLSYEFVDMAITNSAGTDITLQVVGTQQPTISNPAKVIFGSVQDEAIAGGDINIGDRLFGGGGNDTLLGNDGDDHLEGNLGSDVLEGGIGQDFLFGGAQDDVLKGGEGTDTLDGGQGLDAYIYSSGMGTDIIFDADGQGSIEYDGVVLAGGTKNSGETLDIWRSDDGALKYTLQAETDGSSSLVIHGVGGTLFVRDFVSGELGIRLEDAPFSDPTPPATGRQIIGIYDRMIFTNPADLQNPPAGHAYVPAGGHLPGQYYLLDDLGNFVLDPSRPRSLGTTEILNGSENGDYIQGSDHGDELAGWGGDDHIVAGRLHDFAGGGEGDDFIEGGEFADLPLEYWTDAFTPFPEGEIIGRGDDHLSGMEGNDTIFGGTANDIDSLLDPNTPAVGHKGDFINGVQGDDALYGSTGDDVLLGGHGADRVVGGPGNDFLNGDDYIHTFHLFNPGGSANWRIENGPSPFDIRFFPVSVAPNAFDWSPYYYKVAGGDDELSGGGGDDIMLGMLGNDLLMGDGGQDVLSGWEGHDRLFGGDGEDTIAGDFGRNEQPNDRFVEGFIHTVAPGFLEPNTGDSGPADQIGNDFLDGGAGDDFMYGEAGKDVVMGGDGDDQLWGDAAWMPVELHAADHLDGGEGDDVLHGGGGDDVLRGGAGNDVLRGDEGSDTYLFSEGDGSEVISDTGKAGFDILRLDYTRDEANVQRHPDGRIIILGQDGDEIVVPVLSEDESLGIEQILFSDGLSLTHADLTAIPIDEEEIGGPDWSTFSALDDSIDADEEHLEMVDAGAGDDVVHGSSDSISFGNTGDDSLFGGYALFGGEGDDYLAGGNTLSGGPGNDRLLDGSLLDGGAGNDTLEGGAGGDRYFVGAQGGGVDLIVDTGSSPDEFFDAYYRSLGIEDWESRRGVAATEYRYDPGDSPTTFSTLEEIRDYFDDPDMTLDEAVAEGVVVVEPLPALEIAANDYAALEPYYTSGVIQTDALEFGEDVSFSNLTFRWSAVLADFDLENETDTLVHSTLDLAWGPYNVVRIVISNANDPIGSGIEHVTFADGALYTIADLVALAPSALPIAGTENADELSGTSASDRMIGLDGADHMDGNGGHDELEGGAGNDVLTGGKGDDLLLGEEGNDIYEFHLGDGVDRVADSGGYDIISFGASITSDAVRLGLGSLVIRYGDGADEIHMDGFDPADASGSGSVELFEFADGTSLTYGDLIARGFDLFGSSGNDIITGTSVDDRIDGLRGDDFLEGGHGDDTYFIERGNGSDHISDNGGNDAIKFGADIEFDDISVFRGADTLTFEVGSESVSVRWQPDEGYGIETVEFHDGTLVAVSQFLGNSQVIGTPDDDEIEGSEGNDRIGGLGGNDNLSGSDGNDVLEGGNGEDDLSGGNGIDVLDGGNDNDELDGGPAGDTYVFQVGYGHDFINDDDETPGSSDIIRFGAGISLADIVVTADLRGSLHFAIAGTPDRLTIWDWFTRESQKIERVEFSDGSHWDISGVEARIVPAVPTPFDDGLSGTDGNDHIAGLEGNDEIFGADGSDVLLGGDGNDLLRDPSGNGYLLGGDGDDVLEAEGTVLFAGGAGDDLFDQQGDGRVIIAFNRGDGNDTFYGSRHLVVSLGGGIDASQLTLEREGSNLILGTGTAESIFLESWYFGNPSNVTLQIVGSDIQTFDLLAVSRVFDSVYAVNASIGPWDAHAAIDAHLLSVSADQAIGGDLAYRYAMTGGVAELSVADMHLILDDTAFGFSAQHLTPLEIPVNQAPVLTFALADKLVREDEFFTHAIGTGAFIDPDGDTLGFSATLENGDPLPDWLDFIEQDVRFSGTPGNDGVGTLRVRVTASDPEGLAAHGTFAISVENANDAPVLTSPLTGRILEEDSAFSFTIPENAFADADFGDSLLYAATLENGLALPGWIEFDPDDLSFSGLPGNEDVGAYSIRVTATDSSGANATGTLDLQIENVNDAPEVVRDLVGQSIRVGDAFLLTVPSDAFRDIDLDDTLTYSATVAGGDALPAWVAFDAATGTFHGVPTVVDQGTVAISIIATDGEASVSTSFNITVTNPVGVILEGSRKGDVLIGTAFDDVLLGHHGRDELRGLDADDTLVGGRGADLLLGDDGRDVILGEGGRDRLLGGADADLLDGGLGRDVLDGGAGNDWIGGGNEIDQLAGGEGDDVLEGGDGKDLLVGSSGNDVLSGDRGADWLMGEAGDDVYMHDLDGGKDTIVESGGNDTLLFGDGITVDMVKIKRRSDDLLLDVKGGNGSVTIEDWFAGNTKKLETVLFADGTAWDLGNFDAPQAFKRPVKEEGANGHGFHQAICDTREAPDSRNRGDDQEAQDSPVERDGLGKLLEAYLAGTGRYDFEALARNYEHGSPDEFLTGTQVARRWQRVEAYSNALLGEKDEDARLGAGIWLESGSLEVRGESLGKSFGHSSSIGASKGLANMKTLRGLDEGFHRLHG